MSEELKPADGGQPQGGAIRKVALYGLLAMMIGALGYDYKVARPAVDAAYDKIVKESAKINATPNDVFTKEDVATLLEKEPSDTFNDGADLVEVYTFNGGLPFKPHKLFAVYKKQGENQAFYRHAKFVYESSSTVAPIAVSHVPEDMKNHNTDEEPIGSDTVGDAAGSGSAPPSAGAGGGGPGAGGPGGGFDPDAMFDRQDADGDGKLSGDEISDRMKENLTDVDKDSDGSVSKEEMMAYFEARRAQFGGGSDTPRQRERPALEDDDEKTEESAEKAEKTEESEEKSEPETE